MTNYRRIYTSGASWFFTVNLAERRNTDLLIAEIHHLRSAFSYVKERKPFHIDAIVILPDHLHCIWTLPVDDKDYSGRWSLLKAHFSRALPRQEPISLSKSKRRERGIWQRRFWTHMITDQVDYNNHVDYIHWNPVKHGWADRVMDWPHSSFQRFVDKGIYPENWGHSGQFNIHMAE